MANKMQQVLDLCNKQDFNKALSLLENLIKDEPQNSEAWRVKNMRDWHLFHGDV